ncbi:MAG TPA: hypothetical protein VFB44_11920 [Thermoleophilaceae bacterium]|nr:hypothetical protein [Thermoleophilaceae bacterium]
MALDPRTEASERLGGREVRVLEPSPPAVQEGPWFADDPVAPEGASGVVSPVSSGEVLWQDLVDRDPGLAEFCAERWLAAWTRLEPLPPRFASTRASLHRVAEHVMKPARERANGKFGLRYTRGGFGTPFYGGDEQLRVEGAALVYSHGADERRVPLTTLQAAAQLAGVPGEDDETPLAVDAAASAALGSWYGFCCSVLEELRVAAADPSRVQLWPEHFDIALEAGAEEAGARAACGGSPGDEEHAEPYLYVAPWSARPEGERWNATAFPGAELSYAELLAADDQRELALDFFCTRLDDLAA